MFKKQNKKNNDSAFKEQNTASSQHDVNTLTSGSVLRAGQSVLYFAGGDYANVLPSDIFR